MIYGRGLGLFYVTVIYIGGMSLISKLPFIGSQSGRVQIIVVLISHIILSSINYFLARFLNRNGVKHSVAGLRLEKVIIFLGLLLLFVIVLMVYGEFFKG
ncbi:hypothetical protein [Treponema pedis]|uniref:hypothetical protein n=1 Tax=Treponema pedis TaxID=409322 RepID=UPI0019802856|nr:hypothetical protein [Treponema pedis]QSI04546.1 hypothetical protein DYQ05_06160 [Treponema pedis]